MKEIYELAYKLLEKFNSNLVARELARLWDIKHAGEDTTESSLKEVIADYKKIKWLYEIRNLSAPMMLLAMAGLLLIISVSGILVNWNILGVSALMLCVSIAMKFDNYLDYTINHYLALRHNFEYLEHIDCSVIESPLNLVHEIEKLCVLIVKCEAMNMMENDQVEFVNLHGQTITIPLREVRNMFRQQVKFAAENFGLVTPDLKVHISQAKELYARGLACGYFMGDFQI